MKQHKRSPRTTSRSALDALESRLMLAASKVVFTTAPVTVAAGATSAAITVQLQDAGGAPADAGAGGQLVNLSTSSSAGTFVDDVGNPITSVLVPAGSNAASFSYTDAVAAAPALAASSAGLAASMQQETVTATAPTQL